MFIFKNAVIEILHECIWYKGESQIYIFIRLTLPIISLTSYSKLLAMNTKISIKFDFNASMTYLKTHLNPNKKKE